MTTDQRCRKCGGTEREGSWRGFTGSKRGQRTNWFCYYDGEEHEFDPIPDQPTPTSSLEEAREFVRDWLEDCGLSRFEQDSLYGVDAALAQFEAAARAEVIREVEASAREQFQCRECKGTTEPQCDGCYNYQSCRCTPGKGRYAEKCWACDGGVNPQGQMFIARLRALSQGGEGKA